MEAPKVQLVPIDALTISSFNVRKTIGNLDDLKNSIRSQGLLQPVIVRPVKEKLEIVVGQRRFLACKELGWTHIPAIVKELSDRESMILSLTENIQQETLDPIERAEGVKTLIEDLKKEMPPMEAVQKVATILGKSERTIYEWLRILETTETVKIMVKEKKLPVETAAKIASIPKEKQEEIAKFIVEEKISPSEAAKIIKVIRERPFEHAVKVAQEVLQEIEEYTVTVSFPGSLYSALIEFAQAKKLTVQEVIRRAVKKYLGL
ncbi:MAG: ParB/RepB/Spo0J family partition protein [Candidatus Bathyarchaeia archaeon]